MDATFAKLSGKPVSLVRQLVLPCRGSGLLGQSGCILPSRVRAQVEQDFRQKLAVMFQRYTSEGQRLVDYEGLAHGEEFKDFTASSAELQKFDLMAISFNVKIAFFINLYNALAIHGFVVTGPPTNLYQVRVTGNIWVEGCSRFWFRTATQCVGPGRWRGSHDLRRLARIFLCRSCSLGTWATCS